MKFLILILSLTCLQLHAQIGMGDWRLHIASRKAIDVVAGNQKVYVAYENGMMVYDLESQEKSNWTNVNGLSDVKITKLFYDAAFDAVYIGYENGNLDQLKNNRITNIPGLLLAQIPGDKKIYNFCKYQNFLYASTGFCILKLDISKAQIKETYYPLQNPTPFEDLCIVNDTLYALTATEIVKGGINNPALSDYNQWTITNQFLPLPNNCSYRHIESLQNEIYYSICHTDYGKDTVYHLQNSQSNALSSFGYDFEIKNIQAWSNQIAMSFNGGLVRYADDLSYEEIYYSYGFSTANPNAAVRYANTTFIADQEYGLVSCINPFAAELIWTEGPPTNSFYALDWKKDVLAVTGGALDGKAPTYNSAGVYRFKQETWSSVNRYTVNAWQNQPIWDFVSVAINPNNTDQYAVGSASEFPLTILEANGQASQLFTVLNSPLEEWYTGTGRSLVTSLEYDENGNLWVLNGQATKPLKVYTAAGDWYEMNTGASSEKKWGNKLVIDYNGNKWFCQEGAGVTGLKDNGTISVLNDDQYIQLNTGANTGNLPSNNVNTIAIDFDDELWIGTDNGFAILYNTDGAFGASPGSYNAQRLKIEYQGNVEYVLGNTNIIDIEVDGGNRKWMASSNSGLFLLSPDGSEILKQFTKENSPLISNTILDIELDQTTGELYIITDRGLVSYRSDASYQDETYETVKVFPNPARPDFNGVITIQGIKYNSDVKITDISGNLVYQTTSNGGTATWNRKTLKGEPVTTGVYLIWTAPNEGKGRKVGKVLVVNE